MVQPYFCAAFQPAVYVSGPLHNNRLIFFLQRLLILAKPCLVPLRVPVSALETGIAGHPSVHTSTSRPIMYILPNASDQLFEVVILRKWTG